MMFCQGNAEKGFHRRRMMIYFTKDPAGLHFACPEATCGRVAIVPAPALSPTHRAPAVRSRTPTHKKRIR